MTDEELADIKAGFAAARTYGADQFRPEARVAPLYLAENLLAEVERLRAFVRQWITKTEIWSGDEELRGLAHALLGLPTPD